MYKSIQIMIKTLQESTTLNPSNVLYLFSYRFNPPCSHWVILFKLCRFDLIRFNGTTPILPAKSMPLYG